MLIQDISTVNDISAAIASGKQQSEIAKDYGVHESTISKFKNQHQTEIQEQAEKILAELPSMVSADIHEIKSSQLRLKEATEGTELTETEKFYVSIAEKKKENYMRSIGMLNSHTPAMVFQTMNIYNDNRQTISNTVLNALTNNARTSTELPSDIVIDIDNQVD